MAGVSRTSRTMMDSKLKKIKNANGPHSRTLKDAMA